MRKRHKTRYPGITYRLVDETKPDGPRRYIVWFSDAEGNEHTKTLPDGSTLEDAVLLKGQLQNRRANGESLVRPRMTVGELLDQYLERASGRLDETTLCTHRHAVNVMKKAFGSRRVTELTPSEIALWIMRLEKEGKAAATIRRYLAPLSSAYKVALRDGLVASSPVVRLLPHERPSGGQREMRCLSRGEIEKLLSVTKDTTWRTLFSFLTFTGLRISEALALTWDDITEEGVVVRDSKTKAGERTVMLLPSLRRLLSELKISQAPGVRFVFATQEGASLRRRGALGALHSSCKKAGIPKYSLHELRHTFASILIDQRETVALVQNQLGHASPDITLKTYTHLWEAQASVDGARDRLQEMMGGML